MTDNEKKVLSCLCRRKVSIMGMNSPLSSSVIAEKEHLTIYQTRKALKYLKKMGYVESVRTGGQTGCGEVYCLYGYCVTSKATETEEYKEAFEAERAIVKECFGLILLGISTNRGNEHETSPKEKPHV